MDIEKFGFRVRSARTAAGLSQERLLEKVHERAARAELKVKLSQSGLSKIEANGQKSTSAVTSALIADVCGVSPSWLSHNEGPMKLDVVGSNVENGPKIIGSLPLLDWEDVDKWDGQMEGLSSKYSETRISCLSTHSEKSYALTVKGDSMKGGAEFSYVAGDIIIVDPEKASSAVSGDRVIAVLNDEAIPPEHRTLFKVFVRDGPNVFLRSLNDSYPDIADEFHVIGVVIGRWSA